jgi:hypothetical protein
MSRFGLMIEREHEDRVVARELRKEPEPAVPVRAGTREWASAVGSAAVARLARQRTVAREEADDSEVEEPEAEAEAAPEEGLPDLEDLPEDSLPE